MPVAELNTRPTRIQVRLFGALWMPLSLGIGAVVVWRHGFSTTLLVGLAVAAVAFELAAWLAPTLVRPVLVAANVLSWPIAYVTNHAILALLYFGLLTPIGLVLRLTGRVRLDVGPGGERSYWMSRPTAAPERYLRPY